MTDVSDDQREIYQRLQDDFEHYAARCLKIRTKSGEISPLNLNEVQRRIHLRAESQYARTGRVRMLVLKARQPGVSTYIEARFYWKTAHRPGLRAFILTHKIEATDNLFEMAKRFHANCPGLVKPETRASNAKELKFGLLDSSYRVGTANAEGVGRSDTIQLFHGSEVAHWPNAERHAAGVLQAVADAGGTEVWLESTANGASGLFYNLCLKAERGEGPYELVFIPWFGHDEYMKPAPDGWTPPAAWAEYRRLHGLSGEQLFWAYSKNAELAGSIGGTLDDISWLFRQEYPATPAEAFQASAGGGYIRPELVIQARANEFPEPDANTPLILGVDVARGGGDRTRVIDRCGRRLGHVVNETWDDADEMTLAGRLARIIDSYGPDIVFVDVTGGYGGGLVDRLREQNYRCVRGINFGSRADAADRFANRRAEMWGRLEAWLAEGADIADDASLQRDMTAPKAKPDSSGRLVLERKEDIRKRLNLSPDGGDAAALTFAQAVGRRDIRALAPAEAETDYGTLEF